MLSGKRILIAEDNEWIAAALVQTITDYRGIALGPAQTNVGALALIGDHPDGAILDGNLLDGPITPVARALCDISVPLVVFTGLGLPSELKRSHPDIPVILKPSPYEAVIRAIAERIQGCPLRTKTCPDRV
jgi:CheY-like chemotaxis protein